MGEATLLGEREGPGCAEPAHNEIEGQPMSRWLGGGLGLSGRMRPWPWAAGVTAHTHSGGYQAGWA